MKIGLISCTKKKKLSACPAKELYSVSTLFRLALVIAKSIMTRIMY